MKQVETEGETLDEAIGKALSLLGVERDEVSLDILADEKAGLLGFGRQNARVRATIRTSVTAVVDEAASDGGSEDEARESEPAEAAAEVDVRDTPVVDEAGDSPVPDEPAEELSADVEESVAEVRKIGVEVLTEILRLMGIDSKVVVKPGHGPAEVVLDIQGDSGALLIGRRGQTLEALQHIVSRIVAEKVGADGAQPIVDTEDYRGRRIRSLEDMALRLGEKAKRSRKPQSIDALNARDRRVVHMALKDDPWLTTKSQGEGAFRQLLIVPEGDRRSPDEDGAGDDR
ncbi:MAG: Jag N-terminal domain-containing protein [Deltaproteobacteria bacterium]|nr:Jag N-terminal domain-containing protein [Deltaproteobacteria bacterium]